MEPIYATRGSNRDQVDSTSTVALERFHAHSTITPDDNLQLINQQQYPLQDAERLMRGLPKGVINRAEQFIEFMATPDSIGDALVGIGPVLDNATNYYGNHLLNGTVGDIGNDVATAIETAKMGLNIYSHLPAELRGQLLGSLGLDLTLAEVGISIAKAPFKSRIPPEVMERIPTARRSSAGAGGDWPVLNERVSPDVVRQTEQFSCAPACGEMLSQGKLSQAELMQLMQSPDLLGSDMLQLAGYLGEGWTGKRLTPASIDGLLKHGSFAVELRDPAYAARYRRADLSHTVVVDGLDEAGNIMIRDPKHGTRYEMIRQEFLEVWTGGAVWRVKE